MLFLASILWTALSASSRADCFAEAEKEFLATLDPKLYSPLEGPPESGAFTRLGVVLKGNYRPVVHDVKDGLLFLKPSGKPIRLDGKEYVEFPNSTALLTRGKDGKEREFLFTRGVRPYSNVVARDGSQSPRDYVSDVLLFEGDRHGRFHYVRTILESKPEAAFLFEDPRVSVLPGPGDADPIVFLSGTDYSPHLPGSRDPHVMNRYVRIEFEPDGTPLAVKTPVFRDLSPKPRKLSDGSVLTIDAKNATIYENAHGQVVVRTRLRPDFGNAYVKSLAGGKEWKYAEQVFVFRDLDELSRYDWAHALRDLFGKGAADGKRVKPLTAKTLLTDRDLHERFTDARLLKDKGKGLGPGAIPIRIRREGNKIYASDYPGAEELLVGEVPEGTAFALEEGQVKHVTFDHEILYFRERGFVKRHYTMAVKLFDGSLTSIEAYYAGALQPKRGYEVGESGIVDLLHVYPMGRTLSRRGKGAFVSVYAGTTDAHTARYKVDLMKLLLELSPGSARWRSGQVYRP